MTALCVIVILLLLFLILPVGVDASYAPAGLALKLKAGPLRIKLLPAGKKEKKPKPEKKRREPPPDAAAAEHPRPRLITAHDVPALLHIALDALSRFRRNLSVDHFMLHIVTASDDPYDAVMLYGYLNAALGALAPAAHRVFKIRDTDVQLGVDCYPGKTEAEAQIVLTLQIWEIFQIAACAAAALLRWYWPKHRAAKAATAVVGQKGS